jgi:hypothetical protein
MKTPPRAVVRSLAVLFVLLNVDIVLSVLLAVGYGLTTAVATAGTLGMITAEIIVRLSSGDDPDLPPPFALGR